MRAYVAVCTASFLVGILFSTKLVPDFAAYSRGLAYTDPLQVAIIALADPLNNFDASLIRIRVLIISLAIVSAYFVLVESKFEKSRNPYIATIWFIVWTAIAFTMLYTTITNHTYCGVPFW